VADNDVPGGLGFHASVFTFAVAVEAHFGPGAFRHLHYEQRFNFVTVRWRLFRSPAHYFRNDRNAQNDFGHHSHGHEDLERVHGLTEAESCECFSRAGLYLHRSDEFPADAAGVNEKLFPHANKEGWVHLKTVHRLCEAYPQQLMDLLDRWALAEGKGPGVFWVR
jgi:hypothetical protein